MVLAAVGDTKNVIANQMQLVLLVLAALPRLCGCAAHNPLVLNLWTVASFASVQRTGNLTFQRLALV